MREILISIGGRSKKIGEWKYENGSVVLEIRIGKKINARFEFNIQDPTHPTLTAMPL